MIAHYFGDWNFNIKVSVDLESDVEVLLHPLLGCVLCSHMRKENEQKGW